ncbi:MAG TPA: FGGY-family carbohydrate kinase, partial [Candidatus Limnocylindrales bacterium]
RARARGLSAGRGPDGRAEQSPADWWAGVSAAVRSIDVTGMDVIAVCGVGQGPTVAVVDGAGDPVRPAITWQDRRPTADGSDGGFGLLPTMAWLAREDRASVERATWLLSAWDALGLWLSGEAATSLQGHETALDAVALRAAGVRPDAVPPPRPFGTVLGALRGAAAEALGLRAGIPVVAGVNDGTASMLGAGLRVAGDAVDTGGASGGIGIYADAPVIVDGLFVAPAPLPGRWVVGGAMAALGASVDWLRESVLAGAASAEVLMAEAATVPPGAGGLLFLPYLAGERAPLFDDAARGAFIGLTLAHGRAELARAVLEGAAFAMRSVAEPLAVAGAPIRELRLAGRRSPGDAWARIKADVLGVPVAIPSVGESAVVGAAVLAAAGVGAVRDLEAGVAAMTSIAARIEPDPDAHARYDSIYAVYRDLWPAIAPTVHALGR